MSEDKVCKTCSFRANRIKNDATLEELRRVVEWYDGHAANSTIARTRAGHGPIALRGEPSAVSAMLCLPT